MEKTLRASTPALMARQAGNQFWEKGRVGATCSGLRLRDLLPAPTGIQANGR